MAKVKNILTKVLSITFVVLVFVVVLIFTNKYNNRTISEVQLEIVNEADRVMLTNEFLSNYLSEDINALIGSNYKNFKQESIIEKVMKIESVDAVSMFCGVSGILSIEAIQKKPIAKVKLSKTEEKYLTDKGELIKSPYFGEKLIVVNGNITSETHEFVNFIENDRFFKAVIKSINIDKNKRHILTLNYISQPVYIGEIVNLKDKSDNLRFFLEATADIDLSKYKEFNLNYKNQIVAKKQ